MIAPSFTFTGCVTSSRHHTRSQQAHTTAHTPQRPAAGPLSLLDTLAAAVQTVQPPPAAATEALTIVHANHRPCSTPHSLPHTASMPPQHTAPCVAMGPGTHQHRPPPGGAGKQTNLGRQANLPLQHHMQPGVARGAASTSCSSVHRAAARRHLLAPAEAARRGGGAALQVRAIRAAAGAAGAAQG